MDKEKLMKLLHDQAKDLVKKMSDYYGLRRAIKDDAKYCEIMYNLTNNFVKTAMTMTEHLMSFGTLNKNVLYKLCMISSETTAEITEFNIKQIIKERYNV